MHYSVHLTYLYSLNSQEDFPVSGTGNRVENGGEGRCIPDVWVMAVSPAA